MRVEVLGSVERRRGWSRDEKMRILTESLELGVTVSEVARRNDVAPSVVHVAAEARLPAVAPSTLGPATISELSAAPAKPLRKFGPAKERGLIEIDFGGGRRVRVDEGVDAKAFARVLDVLSA